MMQKIWCVWFSRQLWRQPSACPCWRSETVETGNQQMATDISRSWIPHVSDYLKQKRFLIKGMRGIGKSPKISKWWASSWREKLINNKSSTNYLVSMGLFFSAMVFNEILRKAWATNTKEKHRNYKLKNEKLVGLWETKSKHKNWRCSVEVIIPKDLMAHDFKEKSWKRWFPRRNGEHSNPRISRRSIISRGQLWEDLQE